MVSDDGAFGDNPPWDRSWNSLGAFRHRRGVPSQPASEHPLRHSHVAGGGFDSWCGIGGGYVEHGGAIQIEEVTGDVNGDCRTDLEDHATFSNCMAGPHVKPDPLCELTDVNGDGSIDMVDFAVIQTTFSGP